MVIEFMDMVAYANCFPLNNVIVPKTICELNTFDP